MTGARYRQADSCSNCAFCYTYKGDYGGLVYWCMHKSGGLFDKLPPENDDPEFGPIMHKWCEDRWVEQHKICDVWRRNKTGKRIEDPFYGDWYQDLNIKTHGKNWLDEIIEKLEEVRK